ncbi:MAG: PH domain-containing protein, partial [Candidatus Latescibacteria bacterium]|nr:PH domain-containing protein [bacterium]MBD3423206.1 PH domain-containing protein [Candidatus Latescibacterota bacterium]
MDKRIKPDEKYFTKCIMVLTTVTAIIIVAAAIITLIIHLAGGNPLAIPIIWIVAVSAIVLIWIISLPLIRLWIKNLSYVINDDRITIYKGILTKKEQNIPFRAVTDFALNRGLYDRMLGIGSVLVQTAGQSQTASGYEGYLAGLLDYQTLYDDLREKLRKIHSSGATSVEPDAEKSGAVLEEILGELRKIS